MCLDATLNILLCNGNILGIVHLFKTDLTMCMMKH